MYLGKRPVYAHFKRWSRSGLETGSTQTYTGEQYTKILYHNSWLIYCGSLKNMRFLFHIETRSVHSPFMLAHYGIGHWRFSMTPGLHLIFITTLFFFPNSTVHPGSVFITSHGLEMTGMTSRLVIMIFYIDIISLSVTILKTRANCLRTLHQYAFWFTQINHDSQVSERRKDTPSLGAFSMWRLIYGMEMVLVVDV